MSTGTPFSSSVESVRANWPNRFSRTTLPNTGALVFQWSSLRRPSGLAWNRLNNTIPATPVSSISHQYAAKIWLSPINICVIAGMGTSMPWNMLMNFGSM